MLAVDKVDLQLGSLSIDLSLTPDILRPPDAFVMFVESEKRLVLRHVWFFLEVVKSTLYPHCRQGSSYAPCLVSPSPTRQTNHRWIQVNNLDCGSQAFSFLRAHLIFSMGLDNVVSLALLSICSCFGLLSVLVLSSLHSLFCFVSRMFLNI